MNKFVFFIFSVYASASEAMKPIEVYQRGGLHPSRWLHVATIDIPDQYHQINSLYYARPDEGNELLSVSGEPSFYHLSGHTVQGASGLPANFLNEISQAGWWGPTLQIGEGLGGLNRVLASGLNYILKWSLR